MGWCVKEGALYAEHHEQIVVLFSDIKGFTSMSQATTPGHVMAMLDALYQVPALSPVTMRSLGLFPMRSKWMPASPVSHPNIPAHADVRSLSRGARALQGGDDR